MFHDRVINAYDRRTQPVQCFFLFFILCFFIILCCFLISPGADADQRDAARHDSAIHHSIVQVYTLSSQPNYANPWVSFPLTNVTGAGCIISGNRILTNAHVVANHRNIEVRRSMDNKKYEARVLFISHEADLALLTVEDDSFFLHSVPLAFHTLPATRSKVLLYGFPDEENLTITEGILSDVRHRQYVHSSSYLLAGEVFSKIEPGHSGGPVIHEDGIIGMVMQANTSGSVAHMIPLPVIEHFLTDIKDGRYDGIPDMGVVMDIPGESAMNISHNQRERDGGLTVRHIISGSPAEGKIMKQDILTSINGYPVAGDGTVEFRPDENTDHIHAVQMNQVRDSIEVEFIRSGIPMTATLVLSKTKKDFLLIPHEQYDRNPRYFIFGGIIFSPLTKNLIHEWKEDVQDYLADFTPWPTRERKELIIALQILPAAVNRGSRGMRGWIVDEVNGKKFRNFTEFYRLVTDSEAYRIMFKNNKGSFMVIDRRQAEASHESILRTYTIREDRSPDLRDLHAGSIKESKRQYQYR